MGRRPKSQEFAIRLKGLMDKQNIKNKLHLSKYLGKNPSTVQGWMEGRVPGNLEDLKLICDRLKSTSDYLLFGVDRAGMSNKFEVELKIESEDLQMENTQELLQKRYNIRRGEDRLIWLLLFNLLRARGIEQNQPDPM